jgi:hypothetical protein
MYDTGMGCETKVLTFVENIPVTGVRKVFIINNRLSSLYCPTPGPGRIWL